MPSTTVPTPQSCSAAAALCAPTWNAVVGGSSTADRLALMAVMGMSTVAICVPMALLVSAPSTAAYPEIAGSILLHTVYNLMLIETYRDGVLQQGLSDRAWDRCPHGVSDRLRADSRRRPSAAPKCRGPASVMVLLAVGGRRAGDDAEAHGSRHEPSARWRSPSSSSAPAC